MPESRLTCSFQSSNFSKLNIKRKRAGDRCCLYAFLFFLLSISFLSPFYLLSISFLSPSCINFVLILGKVLVDYRIKCSLTLLKSPFIDVEPRFNVFERTFNVYERRFYLGIKSNASIVSILFNGKSCPNPSGNHSPERNEDAVFPVNGFDCFSPFYSIYNLLSHFLRS